MPQRSNRERLLEGAMECLAELPLDRITARVIAERSRANVASIGYHFGSKDGLISAAAVAGLDRWLTAIATELGAVGHGDPARRVRLAARIMSDTRERHQGLARAYLASIALAQHDEGVRATLAVGLRTARPALASVLGLDAGPGGREAASMLLAMFHGLLLAELVDPGASLDGEALEAGLTRIAATLPPVARA